MHRQYALKQVIIAFGIEEWILFGLMIFFLPLQARAHIDLESYSHHAITQQFSPFGEKLCSSKRQLINPCLSHFTIYLMGLP